MSGGVDSSVAAALLKKQGLEVIGATMCFNIQSDQKKRPSCCGIEGIEDARRVAQILGIRHYVLNFAKELEDKVIADFVSEYARGRTPNPCIRCNQYIKFDALLKKARSLDCDYLATGHYARITRNQKPVLRLRSPQCRAPCVQALRCEAGLALSKVEVPVTSNQKYLLKRGKDKVKDQSYFLYCLKGKILPQILFPLGEYTKLQVRNLAKRLKLPVAEKPGSQEICFILNTDYRGFLKTRLPRMKKDIRPGPIKDLEGKILGQHKGIHLYTIGQREGLGISAKTRLYIVKIDAKKNVIFVGKEKDVYSQGLVASKLNFINIDFPQKPLEVKAKIRYNHKEAPAKLIPLSDTKIRIEFKQPQKAITAGQSVVFYDRDVVLGGGIIESSFK